MQKQIAMIIISVVFYNYISPMKYFISLTYFVNKLKLMITNKI